MESKDKTRKKVIEVYYQANGRGFAGKTARINEYCRSLPKSQIFVIQLNDTRVERELKKVMEEVNNFQGERHE